MSTYNEETYKIYFINPIGNELVSFTNKLDSSSHEEDQLKEKTNVSTRYSNAPPIYQDDTIADVKKKIILDADKNITFDEIYLFGICEHKINIKNVYRMLTNNGAREITRVILNAFLVNLVVDDVLLQKTISELPNKSVYTYDDLLLLHIDGKTIKMKIPLSQKIPNHIYPVNPYDTVDKLTPGQIDSLSDDLTTINESLLLDFPPLNENTIYAVLARQLLDDHKEAPTKIYFPYLAKENIFTLAEFQRNEEQLLNKTRALFTDYLANKYSTVALFYSLEQNKTKLPKIPVTHVIKNIKLNIYSNEKIKLPLEYIFKQVHATEELPLIKYNPGLRRDKIIRLYCESQTKKGEKIPYLQKGTIFKVLKQLAHQRSIGFYHKHILVNIHENGIIGVESVYEKQNKGLTLSAIEDVIRSVVNPILDQVRRIVEQSGYTITSFKNLIQESVDILNIDYQMTFSVKKNIVLSNYSSCLGYLFNIISGDVNKQSGAALRYKRVSNFNEMSSQQAFIVEQVNLGKNKDDIIDGMMSNFKLTEEKANTILVGFLNEISIEQGLREGKKTKIKENPGFAVSMTMEKLSNNLVVNISNIDNIYYLNTVPMFVSGVIQLTQTSLSKIPDAKTLCKKSKLVEEKQMIEEIVPERKEEATMFRVEANNNADEEADDFLDMLLGDNNDNNANNANNANDNNANDNNANPNQNLNEIISENIISTIQERKDSSKVEEPNNDININIGENEINIGENEINIGENEINIGDNDINIGDNDINIGENNINIGENDINIGENIAEGASSKSKGGAKGDEDSANSNEENIVRDITGMPLSNPNPFSSRMENRDSTLFLKDKQGKFSAYSRMCPSNVRRQPVILTDAEKAKIDKEHPGSYEHAIKYGSSPDKQHWYICPRYWCLTKNVSLTQEQIDAGECGGKDAIIPFGAKKVPPGKQIFEFYAKSEHDKGDGAYIQHYPGFIPGSKHPDGKCIPCCFKSWDAPEQVRRRAACSGDETAVKSAPKKVPHRKKVPAKKTEINKAEIKKQSPKIIKPEKKKSIKKSTKLKIVNNSDNSSNSEVSLESVSLKNSVSPERVRSNEPEEYIKGPEKFPLEQNRWGYLPPEIASFLDTENEKCQVSATDIDIRPDHPCYLRHGVENDPNQSFVGCIADLYVDYIKEIGIPTIQEMKKVIASAISLDSFPSFQNGNLVEMFYSSDWDGSIDTYSDSELFKDTDTTDPAAILVLERIISAYENFKLFLVDDSVVIDYEYLWDIITTPNPALFPSGINLVILNVPQDDATNNVEVLCPTNAYSSQFFDTKKKTLVLMRKESGNNYFFEPIYLYTNSITKIVINKTFSEYGNLLPNMKQTLSTIKKYLNESCHPLKSQPNVYKFKSSIKLETLNKEFSSISGKILGNVLNYNGKIVGIYGSYKGKRGILPCLPTGNSQDKSKGKIKTYFVDDAEVLKSYEHTLAFLSLIKKANGKIPCEPKIRVVDDEHLIGVLTETNQFIGFDNPLPFTEERENDSDLPIIRESSYVNFDRRVSNFKNNSYNSERDQYIRNIRLEREFYSVFRNIVRITLASNVKMKENLIETYIEYKVGLSSTDADSRQKEYAAYIENIVTVLKSVIGEKVKFTTYTKEDLEKSAKAKVSLCNNSCNENDDSKPFCEKNGATGSCLFIIPRENLINNNNNADFYYLRLADEILRNDRIRQFIMEPDQVLFLTSVPYELDESEIIILNSLLTQEYFMNKRPYKKNIFMKHDTYNTVEPALTEPYSSKIEIVEQTKRAQYMSSCFEGYENIKGKGKESWKTLFGPEFVALTPYATSNCTIDVLTGALHEKNIRSNNDNVSLKKTLIIEYNRLFEAGHKEQIMKILASEGKKMLIKSVESDKSRLFEQIISDTYYFTLLDYWILANYHKLNIVFLSSTTLGENNSNSLVTSTDYTKKFLIIKVPGIKQDVIPDYKIYTNKPKEQILLCDIPRDAENYIQKTPYLSLEEMIAKFQPKKYKKKPKLLIQND